MREIRKVAGEGLLRVVLVATVANAGGACARFATVLTLPRLLLQTILDSFQEIFLCK